MEIWPEFTATRQIIEDFMNLILNPDFEYFVRPPNFYIL